MQSSDRDLARRYLHGVWAAMRHLETRLEPRLREQAGLGLAELVLLEYAAHTDLGPGQLASAIHLPDHAVSRLLGRLERAGLLVRGAAPEDARRRTLHVTPAGRAALARAQSALTGAVAPLARQLGDRRLGHLVEALTLLVAAETGPEGAAETGSEGGTETGAEAGSGTGAVSGSRGARSGDHPRSAPGRP
jgi:DNA-binding MarR family transcriptional regulator